jgi:FKBP-type peptidyl-prolyl cis-trans isomerase
MRPIYLVLIMAVIIGVVMGIMVPALMAPTKEEIRANWDKRANEIKEQNKTTSEEFLAKNKKQKGVITRPSGLQYLVLKEGTGAHPKATDKVKVNYRGTFIDGTEFESSFVRGTPLTLSLQNLIRGWKEAIPLMAVGSKWRIFVPVELAYGEAGRTNIGPNQALIFELELLDFESEK